MTGTGTGQARMREAWLREVCEWRGRNVVDREGEKVGRLEEIYLDQQSGRPEWMLIHTGLFGTKSSFAPLAGARVAGEDVRIGYSKQEVKDAPSVEADGELSQLEESRLYAHYGLDYSESGSELPVGRDAGGPTTDDAMTRSEEELRVGTAKRERGRARLKKYVVTEKRAVAKERVRLDKQTVTDEQTVSEQLRKEQIDSEGVEQKSEKKRRR